MKHLVVLAALACLIVAVVPAQAAICNIDATPAATLLLPYFEVDLNHATGADTMFSVNNSGAAAILAHVVVWSDLSAPVLDFNIYLTGYDVQTVDLRDIIVNGNLPQTASAGQDPADTISPKGFLSQDINFASCTGQLPSPPLPAAFIQHLKLSLTGKASPLLGNQCAGQDLGDHIARGYVTVDVVNNCTLRFPGDAGYFSSDTTTQNVLWGDYTFQNAAAAKTATGGPLVHIEASTTNAATTTPGRYTFYGRYVNWDASDHREPLATSFAARYNIDGPSVAHTSFVVWRDPKTNQGPFACPATSGRPTWYPLGTEGLDIFDEQEHPLIPQLFPFSPQPPGSGLDPFPAAAQRTVVNSAALPTPFNTGWMFVDLNTTVTGNPNPPIDPAAAQGWLIYDMDANGRFTVGYEAIRLDSACAANHTVP